MNVHFEKIDSSNLDHAKAFIEWNKNPLLLKNWRLQREDSIKQVIDDYSLEDFQAQFSKSSQDQGKYCFILKVNDLYIGYGQFYLNHPMCMSKGTKVCWPSIAIGDDAYRGKGFGYKICLEILKNAKELQCTHIEAGVFEFNEEMKSILKSNGFQLIGRMENKTFVNGKWWAAEHFLLEL